MAKEQTKTAVREWSNTAEIGTFLHINKGEAYTKSYTSVNEPLKVDTAEQTRKVGHVRVHMHVEEDTGVKSDGSFYTKTVWNEQERDGGSGTGYSEKRPVNTESNSQNDEQPNNKELTPLQVLKNFVDNIASDVRNKETHIFTLALVAGAALIVGAVALIVALI